MSDDIKSDDTLVGGIGNVDPNVAQAIYRSILEQAKLKPFKHGSTAAYWHVVHTLGSHLKED